MAGRAQYGIELRCTITDPRHDGLPTFFQRELTQVMVDLRAPKTASFARAMDTLSGESLPLTIYVRERLGGSALGSKGGEIGEIAYAKSSVLELSGGGGNLRIRFPQLPPTADIAYLLVIEIDISGLPMELKELASFVQPAAFSFRCSKRRTRSRPNAKRSTPDSAIFSPPAKRSAVEAAVEEVQAAETRRMQQAPQLVVSTDVVEPVTDHLLAWLPSLAVVESLTNSQPLANCPVDYEEGSMQEGLAAALAHLRDHVTLPRVLHVTGMAGEGTTTKALGLVRAALRTGTFKSMLVVTDRPACQRERWLLQPGVAPVQVDQAGAFDVVHTRSSRGSLLVFMDGVEDSVDGVQGLLPVAGLCAIVSTRTYTGYLQSIYGAMAWQAARMSAHRAAHLAMAALVIGGRQGTADGSNFNTYARTMAQLANFNPRAILRLATSIRSLAAGGLPSLEQLQAWMKAPKLLLDACGMYEECHRQYESLAEPMKKLLAVVGWMGPSMLSLEWIQAVEKALDVNLLPLLLSLRQHRAVQVDGTGQTFRLGHFLRLYILANAEKPANDVAATIMNLTLHRVQGAISVAKSTGTSGATVLDPKHWDVTSIATALLEQEKATTSKSAFLSIVCTGYKVLQLFLPPKDRLRLYDRALELLEFCAAVPTAKEFKLRAVALNASGIAMVQGGNAADGLARFQQALICFEKLAEHADIGDKGRMECVMVTHNIGHSLAKSNRPLEGLVFLEKAKLEKERLVEQHGWGQAAGTAIHPVLSSKLSFNASLASTYDSIGEAYLELENHEMALASFDKAIALRKGDCEGLCCCSASKTQPGEEPQVCQCSRTTNLGLATSYLHKGMLMFKMGQFDVAGRLIKRAIGIRERMLGVSNYLAEEAKALGESLLLQYQQAFSKEDPMDTLTCCSPDRSDGTCNGKVVVEQEQAEAMLDLGTWLDGFNIPSSDVDVAGGGAALLAKQSTAERQLGHLLGSNAAHDDLRLEDVLDIDWLVL